jgi:zinc protease
MKLIKFLLIIVIFSIPSFGQSGGAAASVSEFDVNGLKVIFKRRTSSPTVSVGLFVRGGVQNQTPADAGIENLALSAAVESSKRFPRDVLRKELSRTGSVIGAGSTYDFSVLSLTSTAENFARSWGSSPM